MLAGSPETSPGLHNALSLGATSCIMGASAVELVTLAVGAEPVRKLAGTDVAHLHHRDVTSVDRGNNLWVIARFDDPPRKHVVPLHRVEPRYKSVKPECNPCATYLV